MDRHSDLETLVRKKIWFITKDKLIEYALNNDFIKKKSVSKEDVTTAILESLNEDLVLELAKKYSNTIAYTGKEIEEMLGITPAERKSWTKKGWLQESGSYEVRNYGKYLCCPLYDPIHTLAITEADIKSWRSKKRKTSEKQMEAIEKARNTLIENNSCRQCGEFVSPQGKEHRYFIGNGKLCGPCASEDRLKSRSAEAKQWFKSILANKDQYCIADVETTGLYDDEIVEISIIDLDGNALIDSLIKPTRTIPLEATAIHGITDRMVQDAPTWSTLWPEIRAILENKIMLAYNEEFDRNMIHSTCEINYVDRIQIKADCVMKAYTRYAWSDRYIGLEAAVYDEGIRIGQDHRAKEDCMLVLKLIQKIAGESDPEEVHKTKEE